MHLDNEREKRNGDREPWYGRTIIRSCCRLDYANAQDMIDGKIKAADAFVEDDGINKVKWPVNRRRKTGTNLKM